MKSQFEASPSEGLRQKVSVKEKNLVFTKQNLTTLNAEGVSLNKQLSELKQNLKAAKTLAVSPVDVALLNDLEQQVIKQQDAMIAELSIAQDINDVTSAGTAVIIKQGLDRDNARAMNSAI